MQELTLAVVGIDFPNADGSNRRSEAMMTPPGAPIELVPDPKNRHDPDAVPALCRKRSCAAGLRRPQTKRC